jgi:hypothetical protein
MGSASPLLIAALGFSVDAHAAVRQERKGTTFPYVVHPIRVGEILDLFGWDTDHVRAKRRESCAPERSGDKGRELNDPEPGEHAHVTHPMKSQVRACSLETLVSRLRRLNPSRAHTLRGVLREAATAYAIAGSSESTSAVRSEMRATSFLCCGFAPAWGV